MFRLEQIAGEPRGVVADLDPATYAGRDAARLTEVAAEVERLGAAAKVLFAKRAAETRGWAAGSHAATAEQWLANISGCTEGAARDAFRTAERLDELPATAAKFRDGALSLAQAAQVSAGATADPTAEDKLLRVAERGEMRTLRTETGRVVAAATDEAEGHARAHRNRHLRTWTRGFATDGAVSGPTEEMDVLLSALGPLAKDAFDAARKAGGRDSRDAYLFDALIALARKALAGTTSSNAPVLPTGRVRVDLTALLAGKTSAGEVCEIPGVGPVPVAHARKVLSHGLLELVITDGVDVQTVVSRTRHVPEALKVAIEERDQRCKVQGCDRTAHLERHHVDEYAEHHLTTYKILGNACPEHHDVITHEHYTVEINPDGSWTLRAPPHTSAA